MINYASKEPELQDSYRTIQISAPKSTYSMPELIAELAHHTKDNQYQSSSSKDIIYEMMANYTTSESYGLEGKPNTQRRRS